MFAKLALPCPFCNGTPELVPLQGGIVLVQCSDCGALGSKQMNDSAAIAAWNTRKQLQNILTEAVSQRDIFKKKYQEYPHKGGSFSPDCEANYRKTQGCNEILKIIRRHLSIRKE